MVSNKKNPSSTSWALLRFCARVYTRPMSSSIISPRITDLCILKQKNTPHYFPCPTCCAASWNPLTLVHTGVRLSLDSAPWTDSVCRLLLAKIAYHISLHPTFVVQSVPLHWNLALYLQGVYINTKNTMHHCSAHHSRFYVTSTCHLTFVVPALVSGLLSPSLLEGDSPHAQTDSALLSTQSHLNLYYC